MGRGGIMHATEIYNGFKFPTVFIIPYLSGAYTYIYLILCLNTYKYYLYLFK